MKNIWKWIIVALLLVGIVVSASVLYKNLSKDYKAENIAENSQSQETQENEEAFAAPDFTVTDQNGKEVKLSDYKGKPIVLNFWTTWCYYCEQEMPDFEKAYKNYPNVQFLMVNATDGVKETVEIAQKYIEKKKFDFPVFFDTKGEAVYNYYVNSYPITFFIDKDGNLVTYASGMLNYEQLTQAVALITE